MKLSPRDRDRFLAGPDKGTSGILLYGPDPMRTAIKRQDFLASVVGAKAEEEMRLVRLSGSDLRGDPAALSDALRAQGFFPGPRAVHLEDATDSAAKAIIAALEDWEVGDALLVVTAGQLTPRSALRKTFETAQNAYAAPIYADPPGRFEVEQALERAGLPVPQGDVLQDLLALAQSQDPGDFRQTVEKLGLYKLGDETGVSPEDIAAVAPVTTEAALDVVIDQAAGGQLNALVAALPQLNGQGVQPTTICIALNRHFRQLHAASSHPQGPEQGLARARPPVFGPRRDRMVAQARHWGTRNLEDILTAITEADLTLRSSTQAPARAVIERLMMRIAMKHAR